MQPVRAVSRVVGLASRGMALRTVGAGAGVHVQPVRHASSTPAQSKQALVNPIYGSHILSAGQFDLEKVQYLLNTAQHMEDVVTRDGGSDVLRHRVLINAFYEPSTRTMASFAAAMQRLGGQVIVVNSETSSHKKGETLEDSVRVLDKYADAIVIRHPEKGAAELASRYSSKPILNAGDGSGEHPTQALLDVFTIRKELDVKTLDNLTVTFLGDLKHGRTVHSLCQLLALYQNVTLNYVSPNSLKMPENITASLGKRAGTLKQAAHTDLKAVIDKTDVLYCTRVQRERMDPEEYARVKGAYVVGPDTLRTAKKKMVVLHPLPRVDELSAELDSDPRAAYFRQAECGLYMRMALLKSVLAK